MSKRDKLIKRLSSKPCDFTWHELAALLAGFGYSEQPGGKTGGSRVRFWHTTREPITLHKPHPAHVLKKYQVHDIVEVLKKEGLL